MDHCFTTRDATRIAGFKTVAMVDYLCRTRIVVPSVRGKPGRGRGRLYNLGDMILLRAVRGLLDAGVSVAGLGKAFAELRKQFREIGAETALVRYLVTDGKRVFLKDETGNLVDLNQDGQMAFLFVIDLHRAHEDVVTGARQLGRIA